MAAKVSRFGPNPAARFYMLDEDLLWCPDLDPLEARALMDFFHRERKGVDVPSIAERAGLLGVERKALLHAEARLEERGYLLRVKRLGLMSRYVAAFPAIPPGHPERAKFERERSRFGTIFARGPKTVPATPEGCPKSGQPPVPNRDNHLSQIGTTPPDHSFITSHEEELRGEKNVRARDTSPPLPVGGSFVSGDLDLNGPVFQALGRVLQPGEDVELSLLIGEYARVGVDVCQSDLDRAATAAVAYRTEHPGSRGLKVYLIALADVLNPLGPAVPRRKPAAGRDGRTGRLEGETLEEQCARIEREYEAMYGAD